MEKHAWMNLLYDFYGQLLTEKQRRLMEMYYAGDLSLGEIAEQLRISRQAVHDVLRRCQRTLLRYEEKLGLVARYLQQREQLQQARRLLQETLTVNRQPELVEYLARLHRLLEDVQV
ncbi:YlxM family DNA-binding protein [Desulfurispora thermophila]|uniref:YlxM family DNA-binding protein n=1 Tax=Desulfurispora thermophila TaxID=265470 RepID=UPI00036EAF56|nr:putative DNA-binding protein [Desulfurispora thermophila]